MRMTVGVSTPPLSMKKSRSAIGWLNARVIITLDDMSAGVKASPPATNAAFITFSMRIEPSNLLGKPGALLGVRSNVKTVPAPVTAIVLSIVMLIGRGTQPNSGQSTIPLRQEHSPALQRTGRAPQYWHGGVPTAEQDMQGVTSDAP
jgi:hypothetical protein